MTENWPGPVTVDDDDPKPGNCYVTLKMPTLKKGGLFGGKKNYEFKEKKFEPEHVSIIVNVDEGAEVYKYSKNMPEDINPSKCETKVENGKVVVQLNKKRPGSWAAHAQFLIKKE